MLRYAIAEPSYVHAWKPACNDTIRTQMKGVSNIKRLCHGFMQYENMQNYKKQNFEASKKLMNVWVPQRINPAYYRSPANVSKKCDTYLFGAVAYDYPLREALVYLYRNYAKQFATANITFCYRRHPGYRMGLSNGGYAVALQKQVGSYVTKLFESKICLVGGHATQALRKYTEAIAAGCLVLGDVPADELIAECVVEMEWGSPQKLFEQIVDTLRKYNVGAYKDQIERCRSRILNERNNKRLANEYDVHIRNFLGRAHPKTGIQWPAEPLTLVGQVMGQVQFHLKDRSQVSLLGFRIR